MSAWWDGLNLLQQVLYCIAVPSTIVMLIQTVLILVGLGGHMDMADAGPIDGSVGHDLPDHGAVATGFSTVGHAGILPDTHDLPAGADSAAHGPADHADGDQTDVAAFRLFSLRSILAFFVVFGWVGIAMTESAAIHHMIVLLVSFAAGALALYLTALLFYGILKLQYSGNVHIANAVGLDAEVYIPVPAANAGMGKVNLLLQGRWLECDAVTEGPEALKTGRAVRVAAIQRGTVLIVVPK
jgi:hypothetical protein